MSDGALGDTYTNYLDVVLVEERWTYSKIVFMQCKSCFWLVNIDMERRRLLVYLNEWAHKWEEQRLQIHNNLYESLRSNRQKS